MHPKRFAFIGGAFMILLGVLAFIPTLSSYGPELPALRIEQSYGLFLGLFSMNILNKLALLGFGVAGVIASRSPTRALPASIAYARTLGFTMGVMALLGIVPATSTLFGYWPLYGWQVGLHAILAVFGAYFGYVFTGRVADEMPRVFRQVGDPSAASASAGSRAS